MEEAWAGAQQQHQPHHLHFLPSTTKDLTSAEQPNCSSCVTVPVQVLELLQALESSRVTSQMLLQYEVRRVAMQVRPWDRLKVLN